MLIPWRVLKKVTTLKGKMTPRKMLFFFVFVFESEVHLFS